MLSHRNRDVWSTNSKPLKRSSVLRMSREHERRPTMASDEAAGDLQAVGLLDHVGRRRVQEHGRDQQRSPTAAAAASARRVLRQRSMTVATQALDISTSTPVA